MVNGKQLTVAWHVNDLKVSHADEETVKKIHQRHGDRIQERYTVDCILQANP